MSANLANLKQISSNVLAFQVSGTPVSTILQTFLTSPSQGNYETMVTSLNAALASPLSGGARILGVMPDGRVFYDSKNKTSTTNANTWGNFTTKIASAANIPVSGIIQENHNTRPEILQSLLSNEGYGTSTRYSDSQNVPAVYYCVRLGNSTENALGQLRVNL